MIRSPAGVNIKNKQFLCKSLKERKALKKQKAIDLLLHMRSGKVLKHPLTLGQRNHLQGIPKDTIKEYLEKRK
jgi:arsenate reductase-like glutaredoxin family protein